MASEFLVNDVGGGVKKFAVACDRFIVCDPLSPTKICCPSNTGICSDANVQYYVILPCGPLTVTFTGHTTFSGSCSNCAALNAAYEADELSDCTWEYDLNDSFDCNSSGTPAGDINVQVAFFCCVIDDPDPNDTIQLWMRVLWRMEQSGLIDTYHYAKLLDERANTSGCATIDLSDINETATHLSGNACIGTDGPEYWCRGSGAQAVVTPA